MILELIHKNSKSQRKMDYRMSGKKRSQRLLLLALALGAAMVSVMLLSKLREGRVFSLLVRDQDQQILTLQLLFQRERETSKAMKRKLDDFRTKNFILRTQKTELSNKLMETRTTADHLQKMQNEMEASLEEKQNQIKSLSEKAEESNHKVADLSELLKQKVTEVEEAKSQLEKLSTNPKEGRKDNDENEVKNEETPKGGERVKFQTNGDVENSDDNDRNEKPTVSLGSTSPIEQNEDLGNGKKQAVDTDREIETSREDATEIKEESKEPESKESEQKEIVAAQDEQEKPATPRELTIEAEGKDFKVRRNKNKHKGRRRRTVLKGREYEKHSIKEDDKYGSAKEIAHETAMPEIPEGSHVDGSLNSGQGQINLEVRDELASTTDQSEKSKNPRNDEATNESKKESHSNSESIPKQIDVATIGMKDGEDSKVRAADNTDKIADGEDKEITPTKEQLEKLENPREDKAKIESTGNVSRPQSDLNTLREGDTAKQEEEEDLNINPKYTTEDGEDSKVNKGEETMPTKEQTEKPGNPKDMEVKNDNSNDETRASVNLKTEKESDADNHDGAVKEAADVSTTQISESTTNTDDSSSEEDTEH